MVLVLMLVGVGIRAGASESFPAPQPASLPHQEKPLGYIALYSTI